MAEAWLWRFTPTGEAAFNLPIYDPVSDIGTGPTAAPLVTLPGGFFDLYGSEQAPRAQTRIDHSCTVIGTSNSNLTTQVNAIRAKRGKRGQLWRQHRDGSTEWTYARLLEARGVGDVVIPWRQPLSLTFLMLSPIWYGTLHSGPWTLNSGKTLNSGLELNAPSNTTTLNTSPKDITVINGGNATVDNPVITVTAGGANITALTIRNATSGAELTFSGTITGGQALVINAGAGSVKNNAVNAYSSFGFGVNHTIDAWFPLVPGSNSITVTKTGGSTNSTIKFEHSDGWE